MIDLSNKNREILINEIDYVCDKIERSSSIPESIYYLSAIHGMIHRIMNIEFSTDLIFMHYILRHTFDVINGRSQTNAQGDLLVNLDERFFDKVCKLLLELKTNIVSGSDFNGTLKKIVLLTYSITGNGHFLYEKNNIDAFDI